jgi:hypothetical protein
MKKTRVALRFELTTVVVRSQQSALSLASDRDSSNRRKKENFDKRLGVTDLNEHE